MARLFKDAGARGVILSAQELDSPEARDPRIGRPAALIMTCLKMLELAPNSSPGVYTICDGDFYDNASAVSAPRDFGPREFGTGFHSLWIYPGVNALGLSGPVTTFTDPDFGLLHANSAAARDLEQGLIKEAAIIHLFLQNPMQPTVEPEYLAGFVTDSSPWLRHAMNILEKSASPRELSALFAVTT